MTRTRSSSTSISVTAASPRTFDWMNFRISNGTKLLLPPPMIVTLTLIVLLTSTEGVFAHRENRRLEHALRSRAGQRVDDPFGDLLRTHHGVEIRVIRIATASHGELGSNATWADDRAPDPALPELVVERAHESDLRELRRRVDGLSLGPTLPGDRGDHEQIGGPAPRRSEPRRPPVATE